MSRAWLVASVAIGLAGLAVRAVAVAYAPDGTSSRDTHRMRAPSLNTTGLYSVVRNPLYLGNGLMWLGAVASLGLTDTTFVAAGGDRRWIAFGEGNSGGAGRIMMAADPGDFFSPGTSVRDLTNNAA